MSELTYLLQHIFTVLYNPMGNKPMYSTVRISSCVADIAVAAYHICENHCFISFV